jgi:TP901 family phage tail tape measure protein
MSKGFNLTATLNLKGPVGVDQVIKTLKSKLAGVETRVDIKLGKTAGDVEKITRSFAKFNATLDTTTTTANKAAQAIAGLSQAINSTNFGKVATQVNSTSKSVATMGQSFSRVSHHIDQAAFSANKFGHDSALALKRFAAFSIPTTAFFAIVGAFSGGIKSALEFDRQMLKIGQTLERPTSTLKDLEKVLSNLSTGLGVSSKELSGVALTIAQAGLNAKETEAALSALAKTALSPSFDNMANTTEGLIAAIEQFNLRADEYEQKLSVINQVSAQYAVESSDIVTAIRKSGGAFKAAGGSLEELIALFSSIRSTTRESADTIASGLNTIAGRLQRPETIEALEKMNIQLRDMEGNFVGVFEAFQRLGKGLSSIDPRSAQFAAVVEQVGGLRQLAKVVPGITQYAKAQRILNTAKASGNSLDVNALQAQDNLLVRLTKLKESFLELFRIIAGSTTFRFFADFAIKAADSLLIMAKAGKDIIPILGALAAFKGFQALKALPQFAKGFKDFFSNAGPNAAPSADPLAAILERRSQAEAAAAKVREKAQREQQAASRAAAAAEARDQKARLAALKEQERQQDRLAKKQKEQAKQVSGQTGQPGGRAASALPGLDKNSTALARLTTSVDNLARIISRINPPGGGGGSGGGGGGSPVVGGGRGPRSPRGGPAIAVGPKIIAQDPTIEVRGGNDIDPMSASIFGARHERPPTDFFVGSAGGAGRTPQEAKRAENFEKLRQRNEERRAAQAAAYQARIAARERSNLALQAANQRRRDAAMRTANVGSAAFQDRQRQEQAGINTSLPIAINSGGFAVTGLRGREGLGSSAFTDLARPFGAGAATARNSASAFAAFQQGLNPSQLRSPVVSSFGPSTTTTTNRGITDILKIDALDATRRAFIPSRSGVTRSDINRRVKEDIADFKNEPSFQKGATPQSAVLRSNLAKRARFIRNRDKALTTGTTVDQFVGGAGFTSGLPSRTTVNDIGASSPFLSGASPFTDSRNKNFNELLKKKPTSQLGKLFGAVKPHLGAAAIAGSLITPTLLESTLPSQVATAGRSFNLDVGKSAARVEAGKSSVTTGLQAGLTAGLATGNPIVGVVAGVGAGLLAFKSSLDETTKEINKNRLVTALDALSGSIEDIARGKLSPEKFDQLLNNTGISTREVLKDNKAKGGFLSGVEFGGLAGDQSELNKTLPNFFFSDIFGGNQRQIEEQKARSQITKELAGASGVQVANLDAISQQASRKGQKITDNKLFQSLIGNKDQQLIAATRDERGVQALATGDEETARLIGIEVLKQETVERQKELNVIQQNIAIKQEEQDQLNAASAALAVFDSQLKTLGDNLNNIALELENKGKAFSATANLAIGGQGAGFSIPTVNTASNSPELGAFFGGATEKRIKEIQGNIRNAGVVEDQIASIDSKSIKDTDTLAGILAKGVPGLSGGVKDLFNPNDFNSVVNAASGGKTLQGQELRDFIDSTKANRGSVTDKIVAGQEKGLDPFKKGIELSTKAMQDYANNLQVLNKITQDNLQIQNRIAQKGVDISNAKAGLQSALTGKNADRFISDDQFLGGFNSRVGGLLGQAGIKGSPGTVTADQIQANIVKKTQQLSAVQQKINQPGGATPENIAAADGLTNAIRASQQALEELASATEPLANVERKLASVVADRAAKEQANEKFGSSGIKERFDAVANIQFLEAAAKKGKFTNIAEQQRALAGASFLGNDFKLNSGETVGEAKKRIFAGTEEGILKIADQGAGGEEVRLREQQVELLKQQQSFMEAMITTNQQVATALQGQAKGFTTSADKLTEALNKFTPNLTLTGNTTVDVRIVGADVFATLEPTIAKLVTKQVNEGVNKVIADRFPDAGVAPPIPEKK